MIAVAVGLLLAVPAAGLFATPVSAAFPGYNGKIAFVSTRDGNNEIYAMNADGSSQVNLTNNPASDKDPSWSPDGAKIAFRSNRDGNDEIYVMNADGADPTRLTTNAAVDGAPAWSPDGTKIAFFSNRDGNDEIYVMNADGGNPIRLTTNAADDLYPTWSPDGKEIIFSSTRTGHTEIYAMSTDGSNLVQVTNHTYSSDKPSLSPDGTKIAYTDAGISNNLEVYLINRDGTAPIRLTSSPDNEVNPFYSPDGTKIVYNRITNSINFVYIMNADGSQQIPLTSSTADGRSPQWQPIPNKPPVVHADALTTAINSAANASVLANDADEQPLSGNNLTISVQPSHGAATIDAATGIITYTPTNGYSGSDQLTYQICDSFTLDQKCATAVLGITVQAPTPTVAPTPTPTPAPPSLSLTSIGTLKTVSGATVYYYTGHRPTFSGSTTAGATVTVTIHSDPIILTTTAGSDGSWSVTPDQDLPNGDHTVIVSATKNGATTTLANLTLGINTGLADTGIPLWPGLLVGVLGLAGFRFALRHHAR